MESLVDTYSDPITYLPENEFNRLCDVLNDALDETIDDGDMTPLKETTERLHVNGKSFYTQDGRFYVLMHIDQFIVTDLSFTIDQFNSKEDMLNHRNPM